MSEGRDKIIVAMSGGVDSSVAAGLLVEQGYDVQGVSLRMWEGDLGPRVCSDHRGAGDIAKQLGIPHSLIDLRERFAAMVVKPFANDYLAGRTPNPCVSCNREFKLGVLLEWAVRHDARFVATGHYARVHHDEKASHSSLFRGSDRAKDQSYFLFALNQTQLARTLFPLGDMKKDDVRALARRWGLAAAERPESQDICFRDHKALVASYADPDQASGGDVVDRSGKVLGRHAGIHSVTIGQRRGIGVATGEPAYVVEIQPETRRVVVGAKDDLLAVGMTVGAVNWIERPESEEIQAEVQIRYRARAVPCLIRSASAGRCDVRFVQPCSAVTPGQAAVFYRGEQVLGGGWIERAVQD